MSEANSRSITTNQNGEHEKLAEVVTKHLNHDFQKPIAAHTQAVFDELDAAVKAFAGPVILDACCGVGESTKVLSSMHPEALVIGIDKSAHRLERHPAGEGSKAGHYILARADLNDFWRLAVAANWPVTHQYILYPNPWPKAKHLQRRWHGAAVFPYIVKLGGRLEVRSNWQTYVAEFASALKLAGHECDVMPYHSEQAMTPFERKYWLSGQSSYRLCLDLGQNTAKNS